ncbi:suppressor of fused domain protein [Gordonia sp. HY442]|uniref:suppressor of fused domain protein n=1 Tax=Gordonia zhenghanii TaxID=2911516 RepID=UPI001F30C85C|nr:suppressor of fused domain protein [Gordonia zhenghanii]MCF8605735.1 suppressor of fused domain protein [Gordonia zhenghanii]
MSSTSGSIADRVVKHVSGVVGSQPQRASVTFLGLEPVDVLRFVNGDELVFATVGCARHPMHDPNDFAPDPDRGPRAEAVVRMRAVSPLAGLHKSLATLAAAPAVEGLILAEDSLIDLQEPLWAGAICSAFLLTADTEIADLPLDEPADPVRFLRAVPITANEAAWVRLKGADALREAWTEAGVDIADPTRSAVTPG